MTCGPVPGLLTWSCYWRCASTTLEFSRPGSFIPIKDMMGGGPFNLKPGELTDDTSMA